MKYAWHWVLGTSFVLSLVFVVISWRARITTSAEEHLLRAQFDSAAAAFRTRIAEADSTINALQETVAAARLKAANALAKAAKHDTMRVMVGDTLTRQLPDTLKPIFDRYVAQTDSTIEALHEVLAQDTVSIIALQNTIVEKDKQLAEYQTRLAAAINGWNAARKHPPAIIGWVEKGFAIYGAIELGKNILKGSGS